MPRFAANLSWLFNEHAFLDRFGAAAGAGFEAVEFLFPYEWPMDELADRLLGVGLKQVLFNLPAGDVDKDELGIACLPGRENEFRDSVEVALDYADVLGCPRLHCMSGVAPAGADHDQLRECYVENVAYAASLCADQGIELLIEPINNYDIPGYFLNDFDMALQVIEDIVARRMPAPRLQFDIYHCRRIHGDVVAWLQRSKAYIAHFQIAGTPGRNEPDVGDLPLAEILSTIDDYGFDCWVGCEYTPAGQTEDGLAWMERY